MPNLSQLKPLRKSKGLTQEDLAEAAGVSYPAMQKHEQGAYGDCTLSFAAAVAGALGVPIEALFTTSVSHEEMTDSQSRSQGAA